MTSKSSVRVDGGAPRRAAACIVAAASIGACAAGEPVGGGGAGEIAEHDTAALQAPGGVEVAAVNASGSGCPSGSWRSSVSDDGSRVTVAFRGFLGELTSRSTRITKNCTVSMDVRGQDGYQYAPASVTLVGMSDSLVAYSADLKWSGTSATKALSANAAGSFERAFFANDLWSPCGSEQTLHVSSQVEARGTGSGNEFELTEQLVAFRSRRCPGASQPDPVESEPEGNVEDPPTVSDASAVSIAGATTAGSGCPSATTKVVLAPDGRGVRVSFDGANTPASPVCSLVLRVEAPAGRSYALSGFTATAQAALAAGVTARLLTNTAYTGLGVDLAKEKVREVVGPVSGPVELEETFEGDELNFSPCDGTNPSLRLSVRPTIAGGAQGRFQLTAIDALKFTLRSCQ